MGISIRLEVPITDQPRECYCCGQMMAAPKFDSVFESGMTHNLCTMADQVGIYKHVWHPDEIGITTAKQLIEPINKAVGLLESDPAKYKPFEAKNGWGTYAQFVEFAKKYAHACEEYPESKICVG